MARDVLLVQRVTTNWTKASRGGPAATVRSRCPISWELPPEVAWHSIRMSEADNFQPISESGLDVPSEVSEELALVIKDGRLGVRPELPAYWRPTRHRRPPRRYLSPGEWLRWSVNYRQGLDAGWLYGLVTWNIAFSPMPLDRMAFLGTPTFEVRELAGLA